MLSCGLLVSHVTLMSWQSRSLVRRHGCRTGVFQKARRSLIGKTFRYKHVLSLLALLSRFLVRRHGCRNGAPRKARRSLIGKTFRCKHVLSLLALLSRFLVRRHGCRNGVPRKARRSLIGKTFRCNHVLSLLALLSRSLVCHTWVQEWSAPESEAKSDWEDLPVRSCFVVAGTVFLISGMSHMGAGMECSGRRGRV